MIRYRNLKSGFAIAFVAAQLVDVSLLLIGIFFFFQAEDGIRDYKVTGVQTCALPILTWTRPPPGICSRACSSRLPKTCASSAADPRTSGSGGTSASMRTSAISDSEIGRASCRERV